MRAPWRTPGAPWTRDAACCPSATFAAGFDAVEFDGGVFDEGVEDARGVGAAADAGDDGIGETVEGVEALLAGFDADDGLEVADDHGEGVRAGDRADDVVGGFDGAHPVAKGFIEGILEGLAAGLDGDDAGAHELHAEDVEVLAADIFGAHVDIAGEAEDGGGGGGADAMLAGAGFGDDAFFAHAEGEEGLADGVVDFVGAGVGEVFALEEDFGAAGEFGEAFGEVERGGAADELFEVVGELALEFGVFFCTFVFFGELANGDHEGFGDVGSSVGAEATVVVGDGFGGGGFLGGGDTVEDVAGGEAGGGGGHGGGPFCLDMVHHRGEGWGDSMFRR